MNINRTMEMEMEEAGRQDPNATTTRISPASALFQSREASGWRKERNSVCIGKDSTSHAEEQRQEEPEILNESKVEEDTMTTDQDTMPQPPQTSTMRSRRDET